MIEMSHEVKSYHWGGDDAKLALILRRPSTGERRQREDRASNSTPQKMEAVKLKLWDGHTGRLLLTRYPRAAASPSEGDRRSAGNERTGRRTQGHRMKVGWYKAAVSTSARPVRAARCASRRVTSCSRGVEREGQPVWRDQDGRGQKRKVRGAAGERVWCCGGTALTKNIPRP